jgi:hypothetical protein
MLSKSIEGENRCDDAVNLQKSLGRWVLVTVLVLAFLQELKGSTFRAVERVALLPLKAQGNEQTP